MIRPRDPSEENVEKERRYNKAAGTGEHAGPGTTAQTFDIHRYTHLW